MKEASGSPTESGTADQSGGHQACDGIFDGSWPALTFVRDLPRDCGILGARELTGDLVYDAAGEYVGHVVAIMVDTRVGNVAWAVIAAGGFMGIGRRRHAVPWSVITPDARYKRCTLSIDQAQIMDAPQLFA